MKRAFFHFPPELSVFLKVPLRESVLEYEFNGPQSVKHLIEAVGVPHTEVSAVRVNGNPVSFDYLVMDEDRVEILAFHSTALDVDEQNQGEPRFVLDNHLGKLASYLRMLGFDCLYQNNYQDEELAQIALSESRILLTRDHRLLMRKSIQQGYWLRSQLPHEQLKEVVSRFNLYDKIKPFRRCMRCNRLLEPISKEAILHRLQPLTKKYFDEFCICPNCNQIYWQGSHYSKMRKLIEGIRQPPEPQALK
jgi:uncharacterized protein with PIN domain/sulfur carrier protein ThiS